MRVLEVVSDPDAIARILHGGRTPPAMRRGLGEDVGEDALLTFIPDTEQPCRSVLDPYYQLCPGVFLAP